jgi:hydrogenase assembly chaperone HypC/HupF
MCIEIIGNVISVDDAVSEALVETDTGVRRMSLALLRLEGGDVEKGEWVLSHTGFVVARLEEAEARRLIEEQAEIRGAAR